MGPNAPARARPALNGSRLRGRNAQNDHHKRGFVVVEGRAPSTSLLLARAHINPLDPQSTHNSAPSSTTSPFASSILGSTRRGRFNITWRRAAQAPAAAAAAEPAPATTASAAASDDDPWSRAQDMAVAGTVTQGVIKAVTRKGALVEVAIGPNSSLTGLMPYSKLAPTRLKPGHRGDLSFLVGQRVKARVVSADASAGGGKRRELVLSERLALVAEAVARLQPGQLVVGSVARLEDYGALVALLDRPGGEPTGVMALLHRSEMSWDKVLNPERELGLRTGAPVAAQVLQADAARCRVALSLKALSADPATETIDTLQWVDPPGGAGKVLPEVAGIVKELRKVPGIDDVVVGRVAQERHTVAQDLELYLRKDAGVASIDGGDELLERPAGHDLVARTGRFLQEIRVVTALSRDDVKKAITRVISRAK
jgi:predicted RNA-binding protein with RPS1 domain